MILGREELVPRAIAEEDSAAAVPPEVAERVAAVELQGNFMFDPVRNLALLAGAEQTTCQRTVLTRCLDNRRRIETFLGPAWERDLSVRKLATSLCRRDADHPPTACWQRGHAQQHVTVLPMAFAASRRVKRVHKSSLCHHLCPSSKQRSLRCSDCSKRCWRVSSAVTAT